MLLKLAWRNLKRRKRRTAITAASIALGIALCVLFTGLSDGVYGKVIDMAVRLGAGHLVIENAAYRDDQGLDHTVVVSDSVRALLDRQRDVLGVSLRLSNPAIVSSPHGTTAGGFDAVDPELDRDSLLARKIVAGRYLEQDSDVVVGSEVARKLAAKLGSKVVVTTQDRDGETVQGLFRVAGIFETRSDMIDGFYFQIPLGRAQQMLGLDAGEVTQLGVYLDEQRSIGRVAAALERSGELARSSARARRWPEVLPDLANFIRVDSATNYIFQILLFLVILAGVLNTVLMSVMERTYEFGVMLALGMSRWRLMAVVVVECALLAAFGTGLGGVLGWAENSYLKHHPVSLELLDTSVGGFFLEPALATDITPEHFAVTLALVFATVIGVGAYPAWRAGQVEPVEALHTL